MVFFGVAMSIAGIVFINKDFWIDVHYKLADVKTGLLLLISFYSIIVPMFGYAGHYIINIRRTRNLTIAFWAFMTLFNLCLPLIVEGTVYLALINWTQYDFKARCNMR